MTTRRINFPALCGVSNNVRGEPVAFGLAEYLADVLLPAAMGTPEGCEVVVALAPKLKGLRGEQQVGQSLEVSDADWTMLRKLASVPRDGLPPDMLVAFATCNLAIHRAERVTEAKAAE